MVSRHRNKARQLGFNRQPNWRRRQRARALELLESRALLAVQTLPDLHVLPSHLGDYQVTVENGATLLRFSTAMANRGQGAFEIRGAEPPQVVGEQELVSQRIYSDDGTFSDRPAGTFEYHADHGHIHYNGFAQYQLLARGANDEIGDVVASGEKTSFALLDLLHYEPTLPGSPPTSAYSGGGRVQGISVGWADVYNRELPGQSIDITGVSAGDYWLVVEADPDNAIFEADEANNVTRIPITIRVQDLPFDGLEIVNSTPRGATAGPVNRLQVTFSEPVAPETFTRQDITFTGDGAPIEIDGITPVPDTNNTQFDITYPVQNSIGTYTMGIGPNITAADGDILDSNRNRTGGESEDTYFAIFAITEPQMIAGPTSTGYRAVAPAAGTGIDLTPGMPGVSAMLDNVDDSMGSIDLSGNTFQFFGETYTGENQLFVSSNGIVSFGQGTAEFTNTDLANELPPMIAALWDDWRTDVDAQDQVLYRFDDLDGDEVADRLVIEWNEVRNVGALQSPVSFRVALELNTGARAGNILLEYADVIVGDGGFDNGRQATVGARGSAGPDALLVGFNTDIPQVHNGAAILISRPSSPVGDLNGDQIVDALDAGLMFQQWSNGGSADLNNDGIVDALDAGMLFEQWTGDSVPVQSSAAHAAAPVSGATSEVRRLAQRRRDIDEAIASLFG